MCACSQEEATTKISLSYRFFELSSLLERALDIFANGDEIVVCKLGISHYHVEISLVNLRANLAYCLSEQSFHSVSCDGAPHFLGDGQADFQSLAGLCTKKQQVARRGSLALAIYVGKCASLFQPVLLLHGGLCRDALAASVATTLQNVSAGLGAHSLTESVDFVSLSFIWLVGLFHSLFLRLLDIFFFSII